MRTDLSLWLLPIDKLMELKNMPATVRGLREGALSVSCGFVQANGTFRVWANDRFSAEYISAEKVNNWLADTGLLPFFWFGTIFSPASRDNFYEYMAEHMLTDSSEGHTTSMISETVGRDGRLMKRFLTIQYEILNAGQNSYFAMNLRPLQYSNAAVHDSTATSVSFSSTLISTPQLSLFPRSMSRARIGAFLAGGEEGRKRMEKKNEEAVADSTTEYRDSQENCVRDAASSEGEMVIAAKRSRHHDKTTCSGFRRTIFVGHACSESHAQALQHQPEILRPSLGQAKTSSTDWFPCSGYEKFRLHHSQDPAAQNLCGTGASRTFGSRVFVGVSPLRLDSEDVRQHLELRPPECYQPCLDRSRDNINDSSTDGKEDIYLIDKTFTRAGVGEAEGGQEDEHALRSEESPNAMLAELDDYFSSDWRID
ncbi:hypothetical protein NSK_003740 [Nannochloropsis salina CCMP1776]|uniref:Uncharacterized protein n=1 Tax=Nannochloropsis salina CCMP1776 TaxID=1027361 RepID=A0A4D9D4L0_9STRA|nr:hypothetical protein NSK_003740 [Nannochloropsis salina CCMP1776]|eukprot:TFJ85317.1 hypothetical protein NSK_003740 [Nannochloropsis salina CCMP1776]